MTSFDEYERELWAGRAPAYERGFMQLTAYTVKPLLDAAKVGGGTKVLDVGTGPGVVAGEAVRRGAEVTAVDADPGMAETAARNVPGLDVRVAVLPGLPFADETFDAVVGNFVINHVGDPARALAELRRVLRPGGRLALTCWEMPGSGALSIVRDAVDQVGVPWPDDIPVSPFMEYGRRDAFERLVRESGFPGAVTEPVSWRHVTHPEEWWRTGALAKVGSNGVIVSRQDEATVARIKVAYDRIMAGYAVDGGQVSLPAHALLTHATR
ncbi:class I SAM-dependent methyltransferase [Actinomadura sp. SCN-SB]|uniref:class I SAM-dependent methyltransferase n=1 Tax=Actinomadura sp. SCN-SB TaxID=3373092 RepID=UPI00375131A2